MRILETVWTREVVFCLTVTVFGKQVVNLHTLCTSVRQNSGKGGGGQLERGPERATGGCRPERRPDRHIQLVWTNRGGFQCEPLPLGPVGQ